MIVFYIKELTDFFSRQHFTTILNYGTTKSTSTFQEGRLGWTLTRPSYRLIGTHRLTRSVLELRSVRSSSLLSSIIKPVPCIHWSQMVNTELLHYCNKEGFNVLCTDGNGSKARIGIVANNQNVCSSCDSRIGFGTGGYNEYTRVLNQRQKLDSVLKFPVRYG